MNHRPIFLIMSFLIFVGSSAPACAGTYYVWKDRGSDRNAGDTWDSAWKTLVYAGKQAVAGDTVIIRKSKEPYWYLYIVNSGTQNNPIIFRGESAIDPPVIAGAKQVTKWTITNVDGVWRTAAKERANMFLEDGKPIPMASTRKCTDGRWFWKNGVIFYRPAEKTPELHVVWREYTGGSIGIGGNSWVVVENLYCWISWGACISINGGHHNIARHIRAKWCWRGVDITNNANYNLVEDALVEENQEGIMIRRGASFNVVRRCTVLRNGTLPLYTSTDRHAIGLGASGHTFGNIVEDCEVAFNGGPVDNVAVIAFRAPGSVFRNNYIHDNYGSGLFISLDSHGSTVSGNRVIRNGELAVRAGTKGIVAVAIRNSRNVSVIGNHIEDNHVSPDSIWPTQYRGTHGGLDIDGAVSGKKMDMSGLHIENNIVTGTIGGPDFHISKNPDLSGIVIIPPEQAPWWLR